MNVIEMIQDFTGIELSVLVTRNQVGQVLAVIVQ